MRLVLELPESEAELWHYALINDAQALVRADACTIDLLPSAQEVIAVVPASRCAWHSVKLPKTPSARLRLALDGALEERLLEDAQDTHLAIFDAGKPGADAAQWVFACNKPWLSTRLSALQRVNRGANHLTAAIHPARAPTARVCGTEGALAIAYSDMNGTWVMPLQDAIQANMVPDLDATRWIAPPNLAASAEQMLNRKVNVEPMATGLVACAQLDVMARGNLAQFDLAHFTASGLSQRLRKGLNDLAFATQWRGFRIGLAAAVVVNIVGVQVLAHQQKTALADKRSATQALLTQTFPEVQVVVDAPVQMRRQLELLRQSKGALGVGDLEAQLAAWAQLSAARASGGAGASAPSAIEYENGQLLIKGVRLQDSLGASASLRAGGMELVVEADGVRIKPVTAAVQP